MGNRTVGTGIVLALTFGAACAQAHSPPPDSSAADSSADVDQTLDSYRQRQRELFDALRADSSPRVQVLAGRVYFPEDDNEEIGGALRPKREDVVARAAQLAPDDAFVQWMAADQGSYTSSQCGPTRWPEAEVANLLRLEPDNAAAWAYSAAIAHAKGNLAAVDDALSRMASASRADDHLGDEIAAWGKVYATRPADAAFDVPLPDDDGSTTAAKALRHALMQVAYRSSPVQSALEAACKAETDTDSAWQRLGWCTEAGLRLASRGNSFTLREQGLKLLVSMGASRDDVADLQRQFDWLSANAANPFRNAEAYRDVLDDLFADWRGASGEIAATERRLKRWGKPLQAPAGWTPSRYEETESPDEKAARQAWQDYVKTLLDDMRGGSGSDARERALALASARMTEWFDGNTADSQDAAKSDADTALADFAAAHAADPLVQWIAATTASGEARDAAALANLQRVEQDNAAAWAMSLDDPAVDAEQTLQRMAASRRYDEHYADIVSIWLAAVKRHPPTANLLDHIPSTPLQQTPSEDDIIAGATAALAATNTVSTAPYSKLNAACSDANEERKPACVAIGRLMFNEGRTLMAAMIGEMLLRKFDALNAHEQAQVRKLAWWRENSMGLSMQRDAADHYLRDTLATGSEIEALRLAATRAGKIEPPKDRKSASKKRRKGK